MTRRCAGLTGPGSRSARGGRPQGWGYLRFREGTASPWPRYQGAALALAAQHCAQAWPPDALVCAFFNNDQHGAAVADAGTFAALAGGLPPGTAQALV